MPSKFLDQLLALDDIVITTHIRPDGDALGSQLALGRYLLKRGKQVSLINADLHPRNLDWLPARHEVALYQGGLEERARIVNAGGIVLVDVNAAHVKQIGSRHQDKAVKTILQNG